MLTRGIIFFGLVTLVVSASAQDFCSQKLSEAEDKFEQGKFYEVPDILGLCLDNGFTKEEKIRAYRLLTITYLYLDYREKADETYLELLKLSPEYEVNEEIDPQEFINHSRLFTTKPDWYLHLLNVGVNYTFYNQIYDESLNGTHSIDPKLGFNFGLGIERTLFKDLNLITEATLFYKSFKYEGEHLNLAQSNDGQTTTLSQNYFGIEVPIYLKYSIYKAKVSPYVLFGAVPSYLLISQVQKLERRINENNGSTSQEGTIEDISKQRNNFNYSLLGGVGLRYKIGINYLTFGLRYQVSMMNYANYKNRWSGSKSLNYQFLYVDDDFKLDNVIFNISYIKPLYKPRKLK